MNIKRFRKKISGLLGKDAHFLGVAKRIGHCGEGICDECGDVCPVKANNWATEHLPQMVEALSTCRPGPLLLRYTRAAWARKDGHLAPRSANHLLARQPATSPEGVENSLRRAFDRLNEPLVVAIGMMDAWYGYESWQIGAAAVVAGVTASGLYEVFPDGYLVITQVADITACLQKLLYDAHRAKQIPAMSLISKMPRSRQREYYAWLAGLKPNERLFRCGCDRYFNPLEEKKGYRQQPRKASPKPIWLHRHQFGNHPSGCICRACGGPGKSALR